MKKYFKPASKEIVLDSQALLAGSDKDGMLDGETDMQGAKGVNGRIIIDDEDEDY